MNDELTRGGAPWVADNGGGHSHINNLPRRKVWKDVGEVAHLELVGGVHMPSRISS